MTSMRSVILCWMIRVDVVELFVDRAKLLVRRLQLLVGRDELLVGGLQLLVRRLELFHGALQLAARELEIALERLDVLGRHDVGVVERRARRRVLDVEGADLDEDVRRRRAFALHRRDRDVVARAVVRAAEINGVDGRAAA